MDPQDRMVRLTIPAKAEYITLGRLALTAIARVRPLTEEALSDLKLALTEACTNSPTSNPPTNHRRKQVSARLRHDCLARLDGGASRASSPARGQAGPASNCARVRRRGGRDPLRARPLNAGRGPRCRMADHSR